MPVDARYELTRTPPEPALYRKIKIKRLVYKTVGEPYIGRRVKLRYFKQMHDRIGVRDRWRIMDAGSGDGVFAFYMAKRFPGSSVTGLELNASEVRVCNRIAAEEGVHNLQFHEGIPETYTGEGFDLIYCLDVLEHIKDDVSAVRAMRDKLKPGGVLLAHVPNRYFLDTDGRLKTVADEDAWRVNPGHVRNGYMPAELRTVLEAGGLTVDSLVETQGQPIARAHRIYHAVERWLPLRIAILPAIDLLTWLDRRRKNPHGNTVWGIARRLA